MTGGSGYNGRFQHRMANEDLMKYLKEDSISLELRMSVLDRIQSYPKHPKITKLIWIECIFL